MPSAQTQTAVSVSSSKTVASVTSIERDYRGRAANERSSQRRAVPGDPHDAQTPAVRPHSSAQSHFDVYIARSSKTVAYVTSMERDYRGRAANERLSQHRAVPGDPHDAQTSAVRPQSSAQSRFRCLARQNAVASVSDRARLPWPRGKREAIPAPGGAG